jgi:hypothetical protein
MARARTLSTQASSIGRELDGSSDAVVPIRPTNGTLTQR